ncbi:bifunctional aminoglycoside phosphotransferase/ATP-binding protein [Afifella sp. IM 167]|uniref:bifunctional aminoglycoside phosphotransferase/ATP-binding protein n=1 Tax=Afifella sp. IM 167 TaxID=2033586 RepID=UPI001CCE13A8|nr:bifunctional aminoglycoside phosphotransferase/ATP-binding protein [Afifella sp. IM 167]MBZ8132055.1 aminoglycoside phosphotransferase [Afifella sp. IM 167]
MTKAGPAHVVEDQGEVFAFLADPRTHGIADVTRIDTHGAAVFLAGRDVYKAKRAVKFPFMDYSTLEKRQKACEAEIAVNRDNAPETYLGTMPVTRRQDGRLHLGGDGEPVEWLVHMRRFDESLTLDHVAESGGLTPELLARLVTAILASHDRAPLREAGPAIASLRKYLDQNAEAYAESPDLYPAERAERLTALARERLERVVPILERRGAEGFVRRCHGDLHLRNLVLVDGKPTLFDAVEFDDAIATGDVLYDLAFLLMDLWERGLEREANTVLNRYLWGTPEAKSLVQIEGLAALPVFMSIRASIRSKVTAASLAHLEGAEREEKAGEVRQYFAAAENFLEEMPPRLIAVGGLSGSGKTTIAGALAPKIGAPPGCLHLRSDIERKRLAGVAETERLPAEAYSPEATERVYAALRQKAAQALAAGQSVVVDAVHATTEEREGIAAVAKGAGVPFAGLWLEAPIETLVERVAARRHDASDATPGIVRRQARYQTGEIAWPRMREEGDIEECAAKALAALRFA